MKMNDGRKNAFSFRMTLNFNREAIKRFWTWENFRHGNSKNWVN